MEEGECFTPALLLMTPDTDGDMIHGVLLTSIMLTVTAISVEGKGARENLTVVVLRSVQQAHRIQKFWTPLFFSLFLSANITATSVLSTVKVAHANKTF